MKRPRNLQEILARLPDAKLNGDNWVASCPAPGHKTPQGHLGVRDGGSKALVTCHGGRHNYRDICRALGYDSLTYSDDKGMCVDTTIGKGCYSVTPPPKPGDLATKPTSHTVTPSALQSVTGVTVSTLAEAKRLPVEFLKSLGLGDLKYRGQPAVRIPYYSEDSEEVAIRFRLALTGDNRFKWRRGDHPIPYGLNRLEQIRKAGWVLIVEGESDCWTCWFHGIPALGAPGKGIWPQVWGEYLEGLQVFLWQEPEAADFTLRVLKGAPELRFIVAPDDIKDISEAHIQGYDVPALLGQQKSTARPAKELKNNQDAERLAVAYSEAKPVLEADDPLDLVRDGIQALGYGGDLKPALITYLAATSRLLAMRDGAMPVHLLLTGPSSSGKSYTLSTVKKLLPDEAHHTVDAGSPRTVIYDDTELEHRMLVFGEADSLPAGEDNPAASAVRNLLQDHSLHYEVTIRDQVTGDYRVRQVSKPGPTVLVTTSTRTLGPQIMTRLFTLELADSKEQITAALATQADLETKGPKSLDTSLVAFQSYLQLKAPWQVRIPFASQLAEAIGKRASAPRILRDFARLLSLVKAVALLRHSRRVTDQDGHILALPEDYETVRQLVNEMYVDSTTGANSEVRKLVEAVRAIESSRIEGERITGTKLADYLGIGKMAASRRAKKALHEGWLVNREQRKGYPSDFAIGEPMPEVEGLPSLEELGLNTVTDRNTPHVTVSSFENRGCNAVTSLTDDNTHTLSSRPPTRGDGEDPWDEFLREVETTRHG